MSYLGEATPLDQVVGTVPEPFLPSIPARAMSVAVLDRDLLDISGQGVSPVLLRPACDLEIVIPESNEARRLLDTFFHTVQYLERQSYSSSIVVIDNGSLDQTSDLVARCVV